MAHHDRNMLKRADIERFQAWLNENKLAWRPGKGDYQLMQVKLATGWGAICTDAKNVVTSPPALREMIQRFQKGLPYTGKVPRKHEEDQQYLNDLRDDFAMAAMPGLIGAFAAKSKGMAFYSELQDLAKASYDAADAMLAERAKRLGGAA